MNRQASSLGVALAFAMNLQPVRAAEIPVSFSSSDGSVQKKVNATTDRHLRPNGCTLNIYSAGTGLSLDDFTFSVAPTYRLPQGCGANQIAQWKGGQWTCGTMDSNTMPVGAVNQTLRYDASNAVVTNSLMQALGDGGLVAGGVLGSGSIPATGAGTKLVWYPAKAAFRAGNISGAQWDDANIGNFSVAMGNNTVARGDSSTAIGNDVTAGGGYSVAMGVGVEARGNYSVSIGSGTLATGNNSTALGFATQAIGAYSTAMGNGTVAGSVSGADSSTAMGRGTVASGDAATAMGSGTIASGAISTAMGRNVSTAGHAGSFIYGDASERTRAVNTLDNQFVVVASGGVYFFTEKERAVGAGLPPGSSSWIVLSDRDAKTAVKRVDSREVLKKVVEMPMNTWQYKAQDPQYRHMGPMAQDFYAAFHLGESNKGIDTIDADGVALVAIQGLHAELIEKNREIATLKTRVAALEAIAGDLTEMKAQLAAFCHSASALTRVAAVP